MNVLRSLIGVVGLSMVGTLAAAEPSDATPAATSASDISEAGSTSSQLDEVIVTARKRQESILNVPVVESALTEQQLQTFQTRDLKDVASLVPGLSFGDSVLSNGTQVSLRGVGTSAYDPGIDQSVSLNIDGMQISQGLAYSSGMFDLGQIEVLKGPQALFYGKSSPGGVISLRSADPTDQFELIARGGYEFEAKEKQGQIIISGPVTNTLKLRLAAEYDAQDGFYNNIATGDATFGGRDPADPHITPSHGYKVRGTALWNPTSQFDVRLKINRADDDTRYAGSLQLVQCPEGTSPVFGIPFINPNDNCRRDRNQGIVDMLPADFPGITNNGTPYLDTMQTYGTLELNYRPITALTLTSTTGYYNLDSSSLLNTSMTSDAAPILAVVENFRRREVTEELRANSDFAGPLNFTAGYFLERGQFANHVNFVGNGALGLPPTVSNGTQTVDITTNSLFGQARYKIIPQIEIAAGARWTDETRSDNAVNVVAGALVPVPLPQPKIHADNVSPEFTITYKPTNNQTLFGALKQGYKSGSFTVTQAATPGANNAYGDEKVQGGEIGLKSRWLDRSLVTSIAAYNYHYSGLQVGAITPVEGGVPLEHTINAGSAIVYGLEGEASYRLPQIQGLGLHLSANWNHARFSQLNGVPCYGGQTIAAGCNEDYDPTANSGAGGFSAQSQSGLPLQRAPNFEADFGFDYKISLTNELTLVVGDNNHYSTRYLTDLGFPYYQPSFVKADVSVTLQGAHDRWEFAVIGKNVNNALTSGSCLNSNTRGGLLPGTEITGSTVSGPSGPDQIGCFMDRGREVWLRVTLKPFN